MEEVNIEEVEVAPIPGFDLDPERGEWFVIHVLSGHEQKVRNTILKTLVNEGDNFGIFDILIPQAEVTKVKDGKKTTRQKKFFPGYMLIKIELKNEDGSLNSNGWYFINNIPGIIGFLGGDKALPLTAFEFEEIRSQMAGEEGTNVPRIDLEVGETVTITDGAFAGFEGSVEGVDATKGKVTLMVNIFGRSTPVELEYWQIERQ